MVPGKKFEDEIPDSLFREMFRKNALTLLILAFISISVSSFFYLKIMEHKHNFVSLINLKFHDKIIEADSKAHQRMIRLLKSESVRMKAVRENNLIQSFGIDTSEQYYSIQLDKYLYDNLKVEEQFNGGIKIIFKSKNQNLASNMVNDLIKYALIDLKTFINNDEVEVNIISQRDFKEEIGWTPKAFSLVFLITSPVLLVFVLFIAIKEKILISLGSND